MALKYTLDSLDDLPEPLREHYKEDGGKFYLDAEGLKPLADFERVNGALAKERTAHKATKDLHSPWEAAFAQGPYKDKTPAEIVAELERIPLLEADSKGSVSKEKIDQIVESTVRNRIGPVERERDTLKGVIAERDATIAQFIAADKRRTIFDAIREVAAKDGIYHETAYSSPDGALMVLAEKHLAVTEDGSVRVSDDSKVLTPGLPVREALAELRAIHPYLAKVSIGGGANGSNGAGGGTNVFKSNNMTERGQYIRQNPDKWQAMMKAAGLSSPMETYRGTK